MRLLHLSDLHFGKRLDGRERAEAEDAVCSAVRKAAYESGCSLVVVAGDVFNASNPPAAAEERYYRLLRDLTQDGKRAVVVISGNHDSPRRLAAPAAILRDRGVFVFTDVSETAERSGSSPFPWRWSGGVLRLELPDGPVEVVPLPFLNRERLPDPLDAALSQDELERAFADAVRALLAERAKRLTGDAPAVLVAHQQFEGCKGDDTERDISAGGLYSLPSSVVPPGVFDYLAAGHLHCCQSVQGIENAEYSGSPLALDFETSPRPRGMIVRNLENGKSEFVEVLDPHPLRYWFYESLDRLAEDLARTENAHFLLDVEVSFPLDEGTADRLRELHGGIVRLRCRPVEGAGDGAEDLRKRLELPDDELFRRFYRDKKRHEPSEELMAVFREILAWKGGDDEA